MRRYSDRVLKLVQSPHRVLVSKAEELRRKGVKLYNFSAGQPGLPPNSGALEEFLKLYSEEPFKLSRYTSTQGLYELRATISEDLRKYGNLDVGPERIVITSGGAEGLLLTLSVLTNPGDEVFLLDPSYSVYWGLTQYLGLKVRKCVQKVESGFQPDGECLQESISKTTSAILVANPDNPTGRVISEKISKLIYDLAVDNDVWVIHDVAYKHIIYEGGLTWLEKFDNAEERVISINSFSKDLAIPGFRLGYTYGPKEVIKQMVKLKGIFSISSSTPAQYLAYVYLTKGFKEKYLREVLGIYKRRRDTAYEYLRKYLPEAKLWKPPASMYLFPNIKKYLRELHMNDIEFTYALADRKGVIILPGSAFGEAGRWHIRFTFVTQSEEIIKEGIERIREFIEESR